MSGSVSKDISHVLPLNYRREENDYSSLSHPAVPERVPREPVEFKKGD
jgi:hypothetical protein